MNIGGGNMNLTIQNQATKNVAVLGYVALYLCLGAPGAPDVWSRVF